MTEVTRTSPYSYTDLSALRPRFNGMAVAAFAVVFFASVVGLVLGYVALSQIRQTQESGRGLALAAVILGWIGTVGFLLLAVLLAAGSWFFRLY